MKEEKWNRRDLLLTEEQIKKLESAKIALFGLGGVGGYVLDLLVRMGIKTFYLIDGDRFSESNLNRQLLSNINNIGKLKTIVAKDYILNISSDAEVNIFSEFIKNNISNLKLDGYYIIDAIDDINAKIEIIKYAKDNNLKIISMMGAGNRLFADFIVSDIYKTEGDPLSKKMRKLLKESNIDKLKVVYTKDPAFKPETNEIGSIDYVVQAASNKLVSEVIKDILYQ